MTINGRVDAGCAYNATVSSSMSAYLGIIRSTLLLRLPNTQEELQIAFATHLHIKTLPSFLPQPRPDGFPTRPATCRRRRKSFRQAFLVASPTTRLGWNYCSGLATNESARLRQEPPPNRRSETRVPCTSNILSRHCRHAAISCIAACNL